MQVIEILDRSKQGVTNPFYCRCEDGQAYYVKGRGAGRRSLIAEYVGSRLAKKFGLPVPDFEIVEVPDELIKWSGRRDAQELGAGLAFGSIALTYVQEFSFSHMPLVETAQRKDIAVFDWWVRNADRTLTAKGGNPNLLWNLQSSSLAVIDQNQAFDPDFNAQLFGELHVFHEEFLRVAGDMIERQAYVDRLSGTFAEFELACDNVPPEWWEMDGVPANFNRDMAKAMLERFLNNEFWRIA